MRTSRLATICLLSFFVSSAICHAAETRSKTPRQWKAKQRWVGDQLPPVLEITLTNPSETATECREWKLVGKDAGEFTFVGKKTPPTVTCDPKQSIRVSLAWNRKKTPGKDFKASLQFVHTLPGTKSPATVDLRPAARFLPFKYRIKGFLPHLKEEVSRDSKGRIVVSDTYHDGPMVDRLLAAFAEDYSCIATLHELGKTWQGRKIQGLRITSRRKPESRKPAFLFIGAHHANELWSTEVVLDIIHQLTTRYTTDREARRWVDQYEIWCVPLANPDGLHNFMHVSTGGRKNGRDTNHNGRIDRNDGVDLNRNYPYRWHSLGEKGSSGKPSHGRYRGPSAGSEPETQAVMRLADRERFAALITYHTSGCKILVPYTIDNARNPHPDAAWIVGATMAALSDPIRTNRDYMPVRKLYSVDGVDQDWHYWRHGTLAYLWEGPSSIPSLEQRRRMLEGARPGWQYLLRRFEEGPTLSGNVHDRRTGKPLEAKVSIDEIKTFENEVHTSHPETGRFDRFLPVPGAYHVRVEKEGYRTTVVKTHVGREWKQVRIWLSPAPEDAKD
jgi:hypothetical protein